MDERSAGVTGGLIGGLVLILVMITGRMTGTLHETLDKKSEDWLDRVASTRAVVGPGGTTAIEQANHIFASAAFGYGYGFLRACLPSLPAALLGGLYGAGLYGVAIVGIAPLIGITEGEQNASGRVRGERLGLHILYGVATALATQALRPARRHA